MAVTAQTVGIVFLIFRADCFIFIIQFSSGHIKILSGHVHRPYAVLQQPFILTSMLKRIDTAVFEYSEAFVDGEPPAGFVTYDMKSGGVDYATSGDHLSEDAIDQMEEYKQRISDGDLPVPSTVGGAKQ